MLVKICSKQVAIVTFIFFASYILIEASNQVVEKPSRINVKEDIQLKSLKSSDTIYAVQKIIEINESEFFTVADEMPEPIGGITAIQQKAYYPELAKRSGVQGKVFVEAFINENGNVVGVKIIKGIGAGCDESAMKAVLSIRFKPGKHNGKPVKVRVVAPLWFKLEK